MKAYCVYTITNLVNGKKYVGKTLRGRKLTQEHREKIAQGLAARRRQKSEDK